MSVLFLIRTGFRGLHIRTHPQVITQSLINIFQPHASRRINSGRTNPCKPHIVKPFGHRTGPQSKNQRFAPGCFVLYFNKILGSQRQSKALEALPQLPDSKSYHSIPARHCIHTLTPCEQSLSATCPPLSELFRWFAIALRIAI